MRFEEGKEIMDANRQRLFLECGEAKRSRTTMSRTLDAISKKSQNARENEAARLQVPSRFCTGDSVIVYTIHPVAGGSVLVYDSGIDVGEPTTTGERNFRVSLS